MGFISACRKLLGYSNEVKVPVLESTSGDRLAKPSKKQYRVECIMELNGKVVRRFPVIQDAYSRSHAMNSTPEVLKIKAVSAQLVKYKK